MTQRTRLSAAILALVAAVLLAGVAAARPEADTTATVNTLTVSLTPARDNTLYESEAGTISNGAGQYLFAGTTQRGELRRALLAFDLSAIPPWATVTSATLTLHMSKSIAGATPVTVHRALAAWGEGASDALGEEGAGAAAEPGDATWRHTFFPTTDWTTPGGDFDPTALATTSVSGTGAYDWSSAELTAAVQAWVADPTGNFGWVVLGDEGAPTTAKRFDSRENDPTNRPVLAITYEATEARRAFVPVTIGD